jgi:DNA-binding NtrC family response regulator
MLAAAEVLLIEDEKMDRALVQELVALRGRGRVHLTEAGDLQAGLDLLGARAFDLVLLDTRLPDASALSALRAVGDRAPDTPILPHPAFLTVEMRHAAKQRGPWDVVQRGELDRMWTAMTNLLAQGKDEAAATRRQTA